MTKGITIRDLRVEPSPRQSDMTRLSVGLQYPEWWARPEVLWCEVPTELEGQAGQSGDPWLISLLPLAVTLGVPLATELPIDAQLLANVRRLMRTWSDWYPGLDPVPVHASTLDDSAASLPSKTGVFFSGGVDSFYGVLRAEEIGDEDIDDLLFIHGFDIRVGNRQAFDAAYDRLQDSTASLGKQLVRVATNLRETRFQEANWSEIAYGCMLAGVGLTLEGRYRRLVIAAGVPSYRLRPHASHPRTDPLFSTSRTTFIHYDPESDRLPKLEFLRRYPSALNQLRVCFESPMGRNCGHCLKCVLNMAMLEILGELESCTAFPSNRLDLNLVRRTYISQGTETFRIIQRAANKYGRQDISEAVELAFQRTARLDRWLHLGRVRQVRTRVRGLTWVKRTTRRIRPLIWRLGLWLNRAIP